jgi:hypothetical protein
MPGGGCRRLCVTLRARVCVHQVGLVQKYTDADPVEGLINILRRELDLPATVTFMEVRIFLSLLTKWLGTSCNTTDHQRAAVHSRQAGSGGWQTEAGMRVARFGRAQVRSGAGDKPKPLYMSTASQLGIHKTRGVPSLLDALLPGGSGAPLLTRRYMRRLLLLPPPPDVAACIHTACKLLSGEAVLFAGLGLRACRARVL